MWTGVGRPRRACGQCQSQKIRCSGERPICKRCSRLKRACTYNNNPPTSRNSSHVSVSASTSSTGTREARHISSNEAIPVGNHPSSASALLPDYSGGEHYLGIPEPLVSTLVEVYYENAYNANLLLHKRTFLASLAAGTANPHIVLSVCAWAANFYRNQDGQAPLRDYGFMIEWAKRAGKLVFQEAEDLHEDNIVTFCILALFWYGQGSWRLCQLHKGNAYQLLHVIGLGRAKLRAENSWDSEIRRRRLWACYLMQCQTAEKLSLFESIADTPNLTLPWPEEDFEAGFSTCPPVCIKSGGTNGGVYAELVKALTLWSSVYSLIKSPELSISERLTGIHRLDEEILRWWRQLPPGFKLTSSKIAAVPSNALPNILLLNVLYHQSLCALHASIVPLFCWGSGDDSWCSGRHYSAQVAFEQACAVSTLIDAVLSTYTRLSAMHTFVAYAAYSGCAIQIPFMWCSNSAVKDRANANVKANVKMIQTMAPYWKFAALLQIHVGCLYSIHKRHPISLEDEPKHIDISKLTDFKINAPYARTSILGFIEILRSKGDGYAQPGEEINDLGIQDDNVESESQIQQSLLNSHEDGMKIAQSQEQPKGEGQHLVPLPGPASKQCPSQNLNHPSSLHFQPTAPPRSNREQFRQEQQAWQQQCLMELLSPLDSQQPLPLGTEKLTLDACYPFLDQRMLDLFPSGEMPDLFPSGEMPDLSQLETNLMGLDYLELESWNNGFIQPSEYC